MTISSVDRRTLVVLLSTVDEKNNECFCFCYCCFYLVDGRQLTDTLTQITRQTAFAGLLFFHPIKPKQVVLLSTDENFECNDCCCFCFCYFNLTDTLLQTNDTHKQARRKNLTSKTKDIVDGKSLGDTRVFVLTLELNKLSHSARGRPRKQSLMKLDNLPERRTCSKTTCTMYVYVYPFTSYFPVKPVKPFILTCSYIRIIHGRADILILTLSRVEAYKESRQKILVIKYGKHNFKIEMLQYLIDMAASTTRLYSPNKLILILNEGLDSLSSRTHTTYVQSRFDRRFRRSNLARREIWPALPESIRTVKQSGPARQQKRSYMLIAVKKIFSF